MYNHLTNDWGDKEHEIPFDIYHPATRKFVFDTFEQWLKDSPQTDVVRFTTFFYQSRSCSMKSAAKRSSTGLVAPAP